MDLLRQDLGHSFVVKAPETVRDITLDEPGRPGPGLRHLPQRGVATPAGTETVRSVRELRLVVRLKQQAHHLTDQLVRPGRQAERPELAALFRDVDPLHRAEPVTLVAQRIDDAPDLAQRHAVRGLPGGPRRHRALVGVDPPVGQQIQLRVEQLPVQLLQRQAAPAALTQDTQHRFGALHYAYLPASKCPVTWPPSPCRRLSRPPWPGVTPGRVGCPARSRVHTG